MIGFFWALIGGVRGLIAAAIAAVAVAVSLSAYDRLIDDPAVAAAARKDFVHRAELTAAEAQLKELQRQLNAGAQTLEEFRRRQAADEVHDAEVERRTEQEIAAYEKRLAEAGKSCLLDGNALDFLMRKP